MSAAACVKKILCDPSVNKAQAVANALQFLDAQIKSNYKNDPTELINMRDSIYRAITSPIDECIHNALQVIT